MRALLHERLNGCGEGCSERLGLERADVGVVESSERLSGQVVIATGLRCRKALAHAGKRERVVAHGTDVVLGLPEAAALDARARVERR